MTREERMELKKRIQAFPKPEVSKPEPSRRPDRKPKKPRIRVYKPGMRAWNPGRKIPHQDMDVAKEIKFCLAHHDRLERWDEMFIWSLTKQFVVPDLDRAKLGLLYRQVKRLVIKYDDRYTTNDDLYHHNC